MGGQFILGPEVAAFEKEVAAYLQVKHAIGVASGTDALVLALRALGMGAGDEVIVPAFTFFATAEAVMLVGAKPVLVDIDPFTYCLDLKLLRKRITRRTKAVIPVHLYGHPANMVSLLGIAAEFKLKIIEDNAQAFGADQYGRKTATFGDVGCLSFFPTKNLGAFGDAGMVVTNNDELAEKIRMLRTHGWRDKYKPEFVGFNSRLDELQAAVLRVKLKHIDEWNARRREIADYYFEHLSSLPVTLPVQAAFCKHVYHLYVVRVRNRDQVKHYLGEQGIASAIYYPAPLHFLEPFKQFTHRVGDFPVSEMASRETLALPMYPELSLDDVQKIAHAMAQATEKICESSPL